MRIHNPAAPPGYTQITRRDALTIGRPRQATAESMRKWGLSEDFIAESVERGSVAPAAGGRPGDDDRDHSSWSTSGDPSYSSSASSSESAESESESSASSSESESEAVAAAAKKKTKTKKGKKTSGGKVKKGKKLGGGGTAPAGPGPLPPKQTLAGLLASEGAEMSGVERIDATMGVTPDMRARGNARDRLERAIRDDDSAALAVLRAHGVDASAAKMTHRAFGLSFREQVQAIRNPAPRAVKDAGHGNAYGAPGKPTISEAVGMYGPGAKLKPPA